MFRFVAGDGHTSGQKRYQASRACELCRKKKKRCNHLPTTTTSTTKKMVNEAPVSGGENRRYLSSPTPTAEARGRIAFGPEPHSGGNRSNSELGGIQDSGSMANTQESNIAADASHQIPAPQNQHPESLGARFIGDLSPEGIFLAATSPDATRGTSMDDSVGVWLNSALSRRASASLPTPPVQSPSNLFYGSGSLVQKVLVPLLEQECLSIMPPSIYTEALSKIYFEKMHPIFPIIDQERFRGLRDSDPARILLQQSICLAASKSLKTKRHLVLRDSDQPLSCREFGDRLSGAMRLSIEMGLVTDKIVLIQVLGLMSQFLDGPDGGDVASQLCAKAVHHVHSIGLHLTGPRNQYGSTLLCCIWSIDRMNAAFNGRPVLMHDRDVRNDLKECFNEQEPCFKLFLQVVMLLDRVMATYRPSSNPENRVADEAYPSFEELIEKFGSPQIGTTSLATIEILYHAITILSCRSKIWAEPPRTSTTYLRQCLSTSILSSMVGRDLHNQVVFFPFIPYALSLSLSIAYREMRHNKVPLYRTRARAQFQTICELLLALAEVSRSASTTAEMGRKLLREMDRIVSTVAAGPSEQGRLRNVVGARAVHTLANRDTGMGENVEQLYPNHMTTAYGADIPTPALQEFDPAFFDSIADIDVFGMFDPAFNLPDFDAYLESNLNPCFPAYGE